ncbi:MAG: glutathione S-transferase family protein [Chromatiales bacterium]|nr:glutathione S-transferase family protein [Chromatiales bacterium]
MRLFDFNRAPNPRRVRMFIAEKRLDIPLVPVNLYRHEQLSPEFLAINPAGTLPVLETDEGEYISESLAICSYLEARHPDPPLLGTGASACARVLMWNAICEQDGLAAIAEVLRNVSPGFRDHALPGPLPVAQLPPLVARGQQRAAWFFERIATRLQHHQYLAGDSFSFADLTLLACVDFAAWVQIQPQQAHPPIARWYAEVASRPSARL